jgi:hypothetical protein
MTTSRPTLLWSFPRKRRFSSGSRSKSSTARKSMSKLRSRSNNHPSLGRDSSSLLLPLPFAHRRALSFSLSLWALSSIHCMVYALHLSHGPRHILIRTYNQLYHTHSAWTIHTLILLCLTTTTPFMTLTSLSQLSILALNSSSHSKISPPFDMYHYYSSLCLGLLLLCLPGYHHHFGFTLGGLYIYHCNIIGFFTGSLGMFIPYDTTKYTTTLLDDSLRLHYYPTNE